MDVGYSFYGNRIGILVFNSRTHRIPGDPGHSDSFNFGVQYKVIDGKFNDLIYGSDSIKMNLIEGVRSLESDGIKGIVGDCGLMALYQNEMAQAVNIPIFSSSLLIVPLVWKLIGSTGKIGIITGHSKFIKKTHMESSGISKNINLLIQGMEDEKHFCDVVINRNGYLDEEEMKENVISAVTKMLKKDNNEIKAIVIECSNLATYSKYIYKKFNIPVFDVLSCAKLLEYSINPKFK